MAEPSFDINDMTPAEIQEVFDYTGVNMLAGAVSASDVSPRFLYALAALNRRRIDGDPDVPIDFMETEGISGEAIGDTLAKYLAPDEGDDTDPPTEDAPTPARRSGSRGSRSSTGSGRGKSRS